VQGAKGRGTPLHLQFGWNAQMDTEKRNNALGTSRVGGLGRHLRVSIRRRHWNCQQPRRADEEEGQGPLCDGRVDGWARGRVKELCVVCVVWIAFVGTKEVDRQGYPLCSQGQRVVGKGEGYGGSMTGPIRSGKGPCFAVCDCTIYTQHACRSQRHPTTC
jgi:hypothetical protein